MDWNAIFRLVIPVVTGLLNNAVQTTSTPVAPTTPNAAIKDLQMFLNVALSLNPPLVVDGWLGPKTNDAIEAGIAKLKSLGIG